MEPKTKAVRTGLRDLKRQLTFRETMLARRKQRYAEDISAAEWAIQNLKAKIAAETEQKEAN